LKISVVFYLTFAGWRSNIFTTGFVHFEKGGFMDNNPNVIDPLIRERLAIINQRGGSELLNNLFIIGPVYFWPQAIVFHALYWSGKAAGFTEVFAEFSRRPDGCALLHENFLALRGVAGIPRFYFPIIIKTNQTVTAAMVYEKFCGAVPYELFLYYRGEKAPNFFSALKELIEKVHERKILLPPAWRSAGILFASTDNLPVFIGFHGVRIWSKYEEFILGCRQDWRTLLFMIHQQEQKADPKTLPFLQQLAAQVKVNLESKAIV
jgi:hypothetical protein